MVTGVQKRLWGVKKRIIEETVVKNFPKLVKFINTQI